MISLNYIAATCFNPDKSGFVCSDSLPQAPATAANLNQIFLIVYSIIGGLAVLFLVIGGLRYIMAAGKAEEIQKAKTQLSHALIGLVIAASAAAIVNFVINRL